MLYVILGNAEMISDELSENEALKEYLEEIRKAAQRSATLTRQLLGFASKQTVVLKNLDINQEVSTMLKMLKRMAGDGNEIKWSPGDNIHPVRLDPSQLDQILTNLVTNARDAIGSNLGRIEISTQNFSCSEGICCNHPGCVSGDFVLISVRDNGCGIAPPDIDKIFEPFYTTKKLGEGIGLGLSTLHGIAKQNNGFVTVESKLNEGTEFKFYLPAHHAEGEKDNAPRGKTSKSSSQPRNLKVLLVEDEPSILEIANRILEKIGCETTSASSPQEAIRIAHDEEYDFDVLLTDYVMPEINAKELAQHITSKRPSIKILFMSGFAEDDIISDEIQVKNTWFIQKPFTKKALADKLSEMSSSAN